MHPVFLELNRPFPSPNHALEDPNGLLAIGADLSPQRLIAAYDNGIFPWFSDDQPVLWWSPNPRIGLDLSAHTVNKSMQKFMRKTTLKVSVNSDFPQVIERCAALRTDETWINQDMIKAYIALHQLERAHSVEVWNGEELVGGLYGVLVGEVFCGESMFHTETNASKLAFHLFCQHFKQHGGVYIDGQVENPHLLSLGMEAIERQCFLNLLNKHKDNKVDAKCWQQQVIF
ncbi:leucyl/phenylalanyl-tRNA--protein transferase [Agarivorans sp. Alg241-V36]|uniref:leucyl/phenylalanyl-tRNA--protein transferase n=1 Tax=Agarivorans sp. Alg241-V36 TaxID=2305992 RepID=UPI0013D450D8|nr:leucyl/phenylalanyl-tRNA--protein transferase [Agarivorans sp. Alg241-V36]